MGYTIDKIESIAAKFRELPEIQNKEREVSKQEAVKMLSKEIVSLQKRGYSIEQIAEMMRGEGLDIATPTLKNYIQRAKPQTKKVQKGVQASAPKSTTHEGKSGVKKSTFTPRPDSEII